MIIRDKAGGGLLQAELETPLGGSGSPVLVADNGRSSFDIDAKHANQFYRLISATQTEVAKLQQAGFKMEVSRDFVAREG
ncbi:MAG TPA: hypothetical protein VKU02_12290 [Gemmataceae bacterium]|nr:hypothetical protein [Gemmataceae bacterium]